MKKQIAVIAIGAAITLVACADNKERYLDLSTGQPVEVSKDEQTGYMVNKTTGEPLYIYVDTRKKDTIYGKTGKVINGEVNKVGGKYVFSGDEKLKLDDELKYKDGDYKLKVEDDGDRKLKTDDIKVKTEDGETKIKRD